MLERATDDMLLELQQADLHMESYLEENRDGFVHQTVGQYLTELVESRGKKRADVIKAADIHTSYAYAIFAGQKFPARDKILRLALAMQLTLEECQRCLNSANIRCCTRKSGGTPY